MARKRPPVARDPDQFVLLVADTPFRDGHQFVITFRHMPGQNRLHRLHVRMINIREIGKHFIKILERPPMKLEEVCWWLLSDEPCIPFGTLRADFIRRPLQYYQVVTLVYRVLGKFNSAIDSDPPWQLSKKVGWIRPISNNSYQQGLHKLQII